MSQNKGTVTNLASAPLIDTTSNGGGGTYDRLATIESRLTSMEAHYQHLSTKEDMQSMRVDMLKWGIGVLIAGFGSVIAIVFKLAG